MTIYTRDYCNGPTEKEKLEYERIHAEEIDGMIVGQRNLYYKYPEAIRHYRSLFPNNHIELLDWKLSGRMDTLTEEFKALVHEKNTNERDILRFINHKPAHYIIGSLLCYKNFGHHETYIFPEFSIGNGKYYADYLIVGKNSGGYEFVFVELEAPNKSTTIKNGYEGKAIRSGHNQILDWKYQIEADYSTITKEFEKSCIKKERLPHEFQQYDRTRMHYMVIAGLRDDYTSKTYYVRRTKAKDSDIDIYHYDNVVDMLELLQDRNTF